MGDIQGREDIEILINTFYEKVKNDDKIGHIFTQIIGSDWSHHLPVMYSFWDMVLFSKAGYAGNPTRKHLEINTRTPLHPEHFDRWLQLWNGNADSLFTGPNADMAKNKAMLMANLISMKVEMAQDGRLIQ